MSLIAESTETSKMPDTPDIREITGIAETTKTSKTLEIPKTSDIRGITDVAGRVDSDNHYSDSAKQEKRAELPKKCEVETGKLCKVMVQGQMDQITNREDKSQKSININLIQHQFQMLLIDYHRLLSSWETYEQELINQGLVERTDQLTAKLVVSEESAIYHKTQVRGLKDQIDQLATKLASTEESSKWHKTQIIGLKKQIDQLTAKLFATEETAAATIDENNHLWAQSKTIANTEKSEQTSILQVQLNVYQSDFQLEHETLEKALREKAIAIEMVRKLEDKCQQLNAEVELYRTQHQDHFWQIRDNTQNPELKLNCRCHSHSTSTPVQKSAAAAAVTNIKSRELGPSITKRRNEELRSYSCPKCGEFFVELQTLERHVNHCLDSSDSSDNIF